MSCESTIRSKENNLRWYLKNLNESLLQGVKHVKRECLKERLLKIAEWEKGKKLERETNVWTVY